MQPHTLRRSRTGLRGCSTILGALLLAGCTYSRTLHSISFAGSSGLTTVSRLFSAAVGERRSSSEVHAPIARAAFEWDTDTRPTVPSSAFEMTTQAANAVMRAYRDGYTGQSVRLRLELEFDFQRLYSEEIDSLVNASLPMLSNFAKKLWGGKSLKEVKISPLDEDGTTMFYREAENARQDAAAIFLPTRTTAASWRTQSFLDEMKDRLVVLVNPESSVACWSVENDGLDFAPEFLEKQGAKICKAFGMISYYYYRTLKFNWQVVFFRSYPYDWEVYVETLDYELLKIGESKTQPNGAMVQEWLEEYEANNNISVAQKVGKTLRDFQPQDMPDLPKLF